MADEEIIVPPIKMEEEEETPENDTRYIGFKPINSGAEKIASTKAEPPRDAIQNLIAELLQERQRILADTKFQTKDKLKLLEVNHRTLLVLRGGHFKFFKTEQVVYALLAFSGIVLISLALLNVFAGLPADITLAFVGTTLGGTIATIAQKLGRL